MTTITINITETAIIILFLIDDINQTAYLSMIFYFILT